MNTTKEIENKLTELVKNAPIASKIYAPEKLQISNQNDFLRFSELLTLPGITVVDQIQQQLKEYIKLCHPAQRFGDEKIKELSAQHIGQTPLWQYGCWFYYPWSNRLVHLLDEEEFIAVRTSRNQYKITPEEREILASKKIGIVGLSVGQSVSVTLAMERICGELRLADFDLLELTNLNRIRTGTQNLGLLKAHSVAREIAELDPYLKLVCYTDGLTEENMDDFFTAGGKLNLLVEESDGFDIKVLARYKARELQVPVIMEASDRCMVDVERFDLEPNRPILHGILDHLDVATLKSLTTNEEKIPYMFDILGLKSTSAKLKASMLEMQQTITTWPQLASAVTMGGGITADVSRRMLLNDFKGSGRFYVDIDELIGDKPIPFYQHEDRTQVESSTIIKEENLEILASEITTEDCEKVVLAMLQAPTFGNQQSWKYSISDKCIDIYYPAQNPLSNTDAGNIQLNISLGAVVENAKQMAASLGYYTTKVLAKMPVYNAIAVRLGFSKTTDSIQNFASLIEKRKTNRSFGNANKLTESIVSKFSTIELEKGMKLQLIDNCQEIEILAKAMAIAEKLNLLHPSRHFDFYDKIFKAETSDADVGISINNFALPSAMKTAYSVLQAPQVAMALAKWQKGTAFETYHKALIESSNALVFITADNDAFATTISTGEAVSNLWFTAINNSLAFHPICVSLTLLKQMKANTAMLTSFSKAEIEQLRHVEMILQKVLGISGNQSILFAARIFIPTNTDFPDSKRKSNQEFLFKSQSFAV